MINQLHGEVINYTGRASLKDVPRRSWYLDKKKVAEVDIIIESLTQKVAIENNAPLLFLPGSFQEFHEKNQSGKLVYCLLIFGILPDGRKTAIILENIIPYIEVRKPNGLDKKTFTDKVKNILAEQFRGSNYKEVMAKGFDEYEPTQSLYLRITFNTIWDRKRAIKYFNETLRWKTTTDDSNHYERVVCRNKNFSMTVWNEIKHYESYKKESITTLDNVFRVSVDDLVEYQGDVSADTYLSHDKSMVETWDIEAYSSTGDMPNPELKEDVVFAIGKTYHWKDSKESILDICIVSCPCAPHPDKLTIVCKNEKDLLKANTDMHFFMRPDFIIGFNDGDFDWPFVITKARGYNVLVYMYRGMNLFNDYRFEKMSCTERIDTITKWGVQKRRTKLEAGMVAYSTSLQLPGYINIDVRTMFRRKYPTEPKSSLKYYLEMSNMAGKEDMPIHTLFQIYSDSKRITDEISKKVELKDSTGLDKLSEELKHNKIRMAEVAHYCTIDAKRCQDLIQKVSIIGDNREVSNVSHTTLYDAIYYADGMKVQNLVIAEGQRQKLLFSTNVKPYVGDGKYPGAFVFPPNKGLVKPKLTVRERKEYLPEWSDIPESDIMQMEQAFGDHWITINKNKSVLECKDPTAMAKPLLDAPIFEHKSSKHLFTEFVLEELKYPVSGLDFSSLYPSIIMAYNLSPEYMVFNEQSAASARKLGHDLHEINFDFQGDPIRAWSIRHDTTDGKTCLPGKGTNKFGLYPHILKYLFDKRTSMKKIMNSLTRDIERMKKDELQDTDEYRKVYFKFSMVNSKQRALKVFMNTFYGMTGNKISPFFVLGIAGGITTEGQRLIKMVASMVQNLGGTVHGERGEVDAYGCKLYYGDSVTADTPLIVKHGDRIDITTIEKLFFNNSSIPYPQFKPFDNDRVDKEYSAPDNLQIWTNGHWTNIKKVIRHRTNKKMYRINTYTGCVDVTEDHSLLSVDGEIVKPVDVKIGAVLMHSFPTDVYSPQPDNVGNFYDITNKVYATTAEKKAYIYGFFYGSGCSTDWTLNNVDPLDAEMLIMYLHDVYRDVFPKLRFKVLNSTKIVPVGNIKEYAVEYQTFYTCDKYKKVPSDILNGNVQIRQSFMSGYYNSMQLPRKVGGKQSKFDCVLNNKEKIGTQGLYYLCKSLGYKCSVLYTSTSDKHGYQINIGTSHHKDVKAIKTIVELPTTDGYVYDIETSSGLFHCGVGEIVVKNTDSCYISCPSKYFVDVDSCYYSGNMKKIDYCTALVKETFKQIDVIKKIVNDHLVKDNGTQFLQVAYEEVLYPVNFMMKKMYAGVEHEKIVNFYPRSASELFMKGLSMKKRDSSGVLRTVCGEVLMAIFDIHNPYTVSKIVHDKIKEIYDRKWVLEDFKKTAVYRPSKQNVSVRTFMARMEERNDTKCPQPQPGERFEYVLVKKNLYTYDVRGRKTALSVGDRWEYFNYAKDHDLNIDLDYYMTGGVVGQFAQLLTFLPQFQVLPTDTSPEAADIAEKKTLAMTKKYIEGVCKRHADPSICQGPMLKKLYQIANKEYQIKLSNSLQVVSSKVSGYDYHKHTDIFAHFKDIVETESKKAAAIFADTYVSHMIKKYGKDIIFLLIKVFSNGDDPLLRHRIIIARQIEDQARIDLVANIKEFNLLFSSKDAIIHKMMEGMKCKLGISPTELWDGSVDPKTLDNTICETTGVDQHIKDQEWRVCLLDEIYGRMVSAATYVEQTRAIVEKVQFCIAKRRQNNPIPPGLTVEDECVQAINYIRDNLINM